MCPNLRPFTGKASELHLHEKRTEFQYGHQLFPFPVTEGLKNLLLVFSVNVIIF
jgi:hypothetical protein